MKTWQLLSIASVGLADCTGSVFVADDTGVSTTADAIAIDATVDGTSQTTATDSPASVFLDAGAITITNSGSTNAAGWSLQVFADGTIAYQNDPPKNIPDGVGCTLDGGSVTISVSFAQTFFADVEAAMPLAGLVFDSCGKSASFGTNTYVSFDGQTSKDVECGSSTDPKAEAVTLDVETIEAAVGNACPPSD